MTRPFTLTVRKLDSNGSPTGSTYTFTDIIAFSFDEPSQRWNFMVIPRASGSVRQYLGKENRKLRIEGLLEGTSLADMQSKVKTMEGFLDCAYGVRITRNTDGGVTRYYDGVLVEPITYPRIKVYVAFFIINIICTDVVEY